jgi:hypothetical protein
VAYLGNDVFDEFKYEALRRKAKEEGHYSKLSTMDVIKLFPTHNRFDFRKKMGKKLQLILHEIDVLITEMNVFRFKFKPQQQFSMKWRQTDSKIIDPMKIASRSRAKDKKKLVDALLCEESNVDLTVLPIFGMGGLGKTTLAQLIFKDTKIKKHFQLLLWVCVSDNFDVDFLAKRIVEAAPGTVPSNKSPLDRLQEVVSGKRYLLVLDDVWNRDVSKWEKLKCSLQHRAGLGSCVLTTTRDKAIAKFMGTTKAHALGFLDKGVLKEIIETKAFVSEKDSHVKVLLVKMVGDMAEKCSGSPLAATALGSVLRTRHSIEEWEAVLNKRTICDEETGILPILKLSYNVLPSQMRQCFSFCAMFPKDYEIDVEILIRLWMANGFILEEKGAQCPEITGKQIFNELASRSFFQDVKEIDVEFYGGHHTERYYASVATCKIHDLMHDVAQSAMGKECVTITTKPSESDDFPYYSTRHLFVGLDYKETVLEGFVEKSFLGLQTVFCKEAHCYAGQLQFLSRYNSIRALKIYENSYKFLKPKYLHHLRYLDISGTSIESLPEDVSILYHLQTLNLSHCEHLVQLPKQMKYMTALRHLYNHGCPKLKMMPPELRCLTSLQTLTSFVAGTTRSRCSNLGELGLLDLGGQLKVRQLENVTKTEVIAANLGNKKKLTNLIFAWSRHCESHRDIDDDVLEGLEPPGGIKRLWIIRYDGRTWPTWMDTLLHLHYLQLLFCPFLFEIPTLPASLSELQIERCTCLEEIPTLPASLGKLIIKGCRSLESVLVRKQENNLPNLSLYIIECRYLRSLSVQLDCTSLYISFCGRIESLYGDMASVECLKLWYCYSLESIPDAPEAYSSLTYLRIRDCHSLKVLPPCLTQRLNGIKDKALDDHYTGN